MLYYYSLILLVRELSTRSLSNWWCHSVLNEYCTKVVSTRKNTMLWLFLAKTNYSLSMLYLIFSCLFMDFVILKEVLIPWCFFLFHDTSGFNSFNKYQFVIYTLMMKILNDNRVPYASLLLAIEKVLFNWNINLYLLICTKRQ